MKIKLPLLKLVFEDFIGSMVLFNGKQLKYVFFLFSLTILRPHPVPKKQTKK